MRSWPRPGIPFAVAVAVCILARAFVGWLPETFVGEIESIRERFFLFAEDTYRSSSAPPPRVLLLGSSRFEALRTADVAAAFEVRTEEVTNLSRSGSQFWDSLTLLRRNPELLTNVEFVIMDLYPAAVHVSVLFPEDDVLFLGQATWAERWLVHAPASRLRALADPIIPIWTKRLRVTNWIAVMTQLAGGADATAQIRNTTRLEDAPDRLNLEHTVLAAALDRLFPDGPISEVQLHALRELADLMPERTQLLLVWLPFRSDFQDLVAATPERAASEQRFREVVKGFTHPRVKIAWLEEPASLGLEPQDYMPDGAHFHSSGRARLVQALARLGKPHLTSIAGSGNINQGKN